MEITQSGEALLVGHIEHNLETRKYCGWIMKVSADGCIDTLCPDLSSSQNRLEVDSFLVYPNPVKDIVNIFNPLINSELLGTISALDGKVVYTGRFPSGLSSHTIQLESGMYILHLFDQNSFTISKKILVHH